MKVEEFEKLATEMETGTYEKNYKGIERTLFYTSYLGNIASVIFASVYVFSISKNIHSYINGQQYVLPVLIIGFLASYELLKRFIFRRLTINILTRKNKFTVKNIAGIFFSLALISGSFWLSMNGSKQTVNNSIVIKQNSDSIYNVQKVAIDTTYNVQIKSLNDKINFCYNNAKARNGNWGLTKREREDTKGWENDIKSLRTEKEQKENDLQKSIEANTSTELTTTKSNMLTFYVLSFVIECLILIGVGFNGYYWFYSYNEAKQEIVRNPNYKKYKNFKYMLIILFQNGAKVAEDQLPTVEAFKKMIKLHDSDCTPQDAEDLMLVGFELGIIKKPNDTVKANTTLDIALDRIKQYLIVD